MQVNHLTREYQNESYIKVDEVNDQANKDDIRRSHRPGRAI